MRRQRKVETLLPLVESILSDSADVYLLFVDLCGSTQYKQKLITQGQPDLDWIVRQLMFLQRAAEFVKNYGGIVVKTIGDELFAFFEATTNPEDVIKCAVEIIQSFDNLKSFRGNAKIEAKASIDFGLTYNGSIVNSVRFDPIGQAVDRCARLNSVAGNNEILFSEDYLAAVKTKHSIAAFATRYGYSEFSEDLKGFGVTTFYKILAK